MRAALLPGAEDGTGALNVSGEEVNMTHLHVNNLTEYAPSPSFTYLQLPGFFRPSYDSALPATSGTTTGTTTTTTTARPQMSNAANSTEPVDRSQTPDR